MGYAIPSTSRSLQAAVACGLVSLALGACGAERDNGGQSGETTKQSTTDPPLQRRDAPPKGVKGQLRTGSVGNGSCGPGPGSQPRIEFLRKFFSYEGDYDPEREDEPERGDQLDICLPGFSESEPIEAEVRAPDGKSYRRQAIRPPKVETSTVVWDTLPGDPFGTYRVTARQGRRVAARSFVLKPRTSPRIRVLGRRHSFESGGPPGTPFTIMLVGLQPRQRVRLDIYHQALTATGGYRYVTSVPVTLDDEGEAIYTIKTAKEDPRGNYTVATSVPSLVGASPGQFLLK